MSKLTLVGLPIGNIEDITIRAKKVLDQDGIFLAEDTRVFRSLLGHLNIDSKNKKIISFHDHSGDKKFDFVLKHLSQGDEVFLVSDAGSPVISDPAYPLIREVVKAGYEINTIPGVSSVMTALELSGLPANPFFFYGFITREREKKRSTFERISTISGTHIFFEAPSRVETTLEFLKEIIPDSDVVVARELTKKFEEVYRFKAVDPPQITIKGEFVILIHIGKHQDSASSGISLKLKGLAQDYIENGGGTKKMSKILALIINEDAKDVYKKLIKN